MIERIDNYFFVFEGISETAVQLCVVSCVYLQTVQDEGKVERRGEERERERGLLSVPCKHH